MISYNFSLQGKSHIERGSVCQDYSGVVRLDAKWMLAMAADGVGSAPKAEVGSRMAVELLGEFCKKKHSSKMSDRERESLLCEGYAYAMRGIARYAEKQDQPLEDFDTTLSAVLYDGEKVVYGHAGDGGILVRLRNGKTVPLTERQKGADGTSVIPLRAGESFWAFGTSGEKTAAVLLATDGMLDGVFQPVLVNLPPDLTALVKGNFSKKNVYVTAAEFFMNPDCVYKNRKIKNPDQLMEEFVTGDLDPESQDVFWDCLKNAYTHLVGKKTTEMLEKEITKYHYTVWALNKVTDDKTVVCLMNEKAKTEAQSEEYYREPDWKARQEHYNAMLYGKKREVTSEGGGAIRKKNPLKPPEKVVRVRKTGYGYVIGILAAVVLFTGLGIGTIRYLTGEGEERKEAHRTYAPYTTEPADFNTAVPETGREEESLGRKEKRLLKENAKKFLELLSDDSWDMYDEEVFSELRDVLEYHGMNKWIDKWMDCRFGELSIETEKENTSVSGSGITSEKKRKRGKNTNRPAENKASQLVTCILLINTEEEKQIFMDGFQEAFAGLSKKKVFYATETWNRIQKDE